MKLQLPLTLLAAVMAVYTAGADVLPASGTSDTIVPMTDGQFALDGDTNYTNVHFYSLHGSISSIAFDGQGLYALNMAKDENDLVVDPPANNQRRFLIFLRDSTGSSDLKVEFANLTSLRLDETGQRGPNPNGGGVDVFANGNHDGMIAVTDIAGDVYLGGFNDASALRAQAGRHATILISGVGGKLTISDNSAVNMSNYGPALTAWSHSAGGDASIVIKDIRGGIEISRNANQGVGALSASSQKGATGILISDVSGGILMEGNTDYYGPLNTVGATDGILDISRVSGDVVFRDNASTAYGGVAVVAGINGHTTFNLSNIRGDVLFESNTADELGGVMLFQATGTGGDLTIGGIEGDVVFRDNSAGVAGGAIMSTGDDTDGSESRINMILSADGGDIVFEGNTADGVANAIYAEGRHGIVLRAGEGRNVYFYDPLVLDTGLDSTLDINEQGYGGRVVFSGERADASDAANVTSSIDADAMLNGGTLSIEHGAVLETRDFIQHAGLMAVTGKASLSADSFLQSGGTLVLGSGSSLEAAGNISALSLVIQLDGGAAPTITAGGSLRIDGSIALQTVGGTPVPETVLGIQAASIEGQLANPSSIQTRVVADSGLENNVMMSWGNIVTDPVSGMQSLSLYSSSTVIGVTPALYGSHVPNSLLSSASNAQTLASTALAQVNPLRFRMEKDTNLWTSGLGDFSSQRSRGGLDGYDYQGGGYSLGIDHRFRKEWVAGVAFGQLFGKSMSRDYHSKIKQQSIMGMLYGAWNREFNDRHGLTVAASVTYGNTDNDLTTYQWDGKRSSGDWHNNTFIYNLRAAWNISLGHGYVLSPFAALEYTDATQDSFSETGERTRRFGKGHYRNLSSPVGVGLGKAVALANGMQWFNSVELSYVPDLYRHNAEANTELSGYRWHVRGVKPARNAVRAGYQTRLVLSESWQAYGGYAFEGRSDAAWHQVNLGASYSF